MLNIWSHFPISLLCEYVEGVASPTSITSQRSFQIDASTSHFKEPKSTTSHRQNYHINDQQHQKQQSQQQQDINDISQFFQENSRPYSAPSNNLRPTVQSPLNVTNIGSTNEGEFIICDLGKSLPSPPNWGETTRSALRTATG